MKALACQAQRAIFNIKKLYFRLGQLEMDVCWELFDKQTEPILCYGAELWGYKVHENIERVQY